MKSTFVLRQFLMLLVSVILAGLVAAAEYYGRPIQFSIFYLLAIFVCVHNVGRWPGIVLAAICGGAWMAMDLNFNPMYSTSDRDITFQRVDRVIGYWNGFALTGVFVIFAVLVSSVEEALKREKKINKNLETLMTLSPADPGGWLASSAPSPLSAPLLDSPPPDPPSSDEPIPTPPASGPS